MEQKYEWLPGVLVSSVSRDIRCDFMKMSEIVTSKANSSLCDQRISRTIRFFSIHWQANWSSSDHWSWFLFSGSELSVVGMCEVIGPNITCSCEFNVPTFRLHPQTEYSLANYLVPSQTSFHNKFSASLAHLLLNVCRWTLYWNQFIFWCFLWVNHHAGRLVFLGRLLTSLSQASLCYSSPLLSLKNEARYG